MDWIDVRTRPADKPQAKWDEVEPVYVPVMLTCLDCLPDDPVDVTDLGQAWTAHITSKEPSL